MIAPSPSQCFVHIFARMSAGIRASLRCTQAWCHSFSRKGWTAACMPHCVRKYVSSSAYHECWQIHFYLGRTRALIITNQLRRRAWTSRSQGRSQGVVGLPARVAAHRVCRYVPSVFLPLSLTDSFHSTVCHGRWSCARAQYLRREGDH